MSNSVRNIIKKMLYKGAMTQNEYDKVMRKLDEQKWIPCSDRLPGELYVLCCDIYGYQFIGTPYEDDDCKTGFGAENMERYFHNCVAWMPLPEPYKGEEEE